MLFASTPPNGCMDWSLKVTPSAAFGVPQQVVVGCLLRVSKTVWMLLPSVTVVAAPLKLAVWDVVFGSPAHVSQGPSVSANLYPGVSGERQCDQSFNHLLVTKLRSLSENPRKFSSD